VEALLEEVFTPLFGNASAFEEGIGKFVCESQPDPKDIRKII
jgi:hypothetical protein